MTALEEFRARLTSDWIPSFCTARAERRYFADGFKWETVEQVAEFDARWFLTAVDAGLVTEEDGFFTAPMSRAREQLFWSGPAHEERRSFTLWLEPIITIGALARLHVQHGWPRELLGCQSRDYGLDLVCYDASGRFVVAGEVKKTQKEVRFLLESMRNYAADPELPEPARGPLRNAFKKVASIRGNWPAAFWAVGPAGLSEVYRVARAAEAASFALETVDVSYLTCRQFGAA